MIISSYTPTEITTDQAIAAKEMVIDAIYRQFPNSALISKVSAEKQIVAGVNYRLTVEMTGSRISRKIYVGTVYVDQHNVMSLTDLRQTQ